MKTVVTKGEFARLKNRSACAVTKWINGGRITPRALIGDGRKARIWVEQAERDLAVALDPAQQAAQAHPAGGESSLAQPIAATIIPSQRPISASTVEDEDLRRRRKADADKAEHDAEAARRKLMVDEGRWMEAAAATRDWGRELARIVGDFETFLCNMLARETAERFGLDWKQVSTMFREAYRKRRIEIAEGARTERIALEAELAEAAE